MSRSVAKDLEPPENSVMVSIWTPNTTNFTARGAPFFRFRWESFLSIDFYDTEFGNETYPPITEEQGKIIFDFVMLHKDKDILCVHCDAGISRSAAVAIFFAEMWEIPYMDRLDRRVPHTQKFESTLYKVSEYPHGNSAVKKELTKAYLETLQL